MTEEERCPSFVIQTNNLIRINQVKLSTQLFYFTVNYYCLLTWFSFIDYLNVFMNKDLICVVLEKLNGVLLKVKEWNLRNIVHSYGILWINEKKLILVRSGIEPAFFD